MATKSIESHIKKIRLKVTISHALIVFIFSLAVLIGYYYASYYKYIDYSKDSLRDTVERANSNLVFDNIEGLHVPNGYYLAIFNHFGDVMFGYLPTIINLKYGFQKSTNYIFLVAKPKGILFMNGYLVVGKHIASFYDVLLNYINVWLGTAILFSLLYSLGIYFLSKQWFMPVLETYENLNDSSNTFAHELLTPISSALFYIDNEDVKNNLIKVKDLIEDFLTFQKYHAMPRKNVRIDLFEILDVIKKELKQIFEDKGITLKENILVKTIFSNQELLYLALKNSLENAAKHGLKNSVVYIKSEKESKFVKIGITNRSEEIVEKLEKFRSKKGFGLGIYIIKKAIEDLGGRVEIEIGEYTDVRLYIPR